MADQAIITHQGEIMDLNENRIKLEQDGWSIEVEKTSICLICLLGGGEDAHMGTSINTFDKRILINNIGIVDDADCDFASEHEDVVDHILQTLIVQGKVRKVEEDGEIKYQHVAPN